MVLSIFDDFTNKILYYEYENDEVFFLGSSTFTEKTSCVFYIPDSFLLASVPSLEAEQLVDLEETLYSSGDFWFDSFSFEDSDFCSLVEQHIWICFYPPSIQLEYSCSELFNSAKLPMFFSIVGEKNYINLTTTLPFIRYHQKRKTFRRDWFCWFLGFKSLGVVALFFRFCSFTIWFKTIGEGAFCAKLDDFHVQVCLGENHDIVFETLDYVYIKDKSKNNRVFGCHSFHRSNLMAFAHKVRTYYVFNVYEYRGLLFLCERVHKKVTKRRVR